MRTLGIWMLVLGGLVAAFAVFVFDPSVASGYDGGRVNNLGLMQDRQNYLIFGCALAVVGSILTAMGGRQQVPMAPPKQGASLPRADATEVEDEFLEAIRRENLSRMRELLDGGVVKAYGESRLGRSWLASAIAHGRLASSKLLLERGASANLPDSQKSLPINVARQGGSVELMALVASYIKPVAGDVAAPPAVKPLTLPDQLERLVALREKGMLTPEEFERAKGRIMGV